MSRSSRFLITSLLTFAIATAPALTPAQARPAPAVAQVLATQPLMTGTAWYPEQWPESRWDADLALMEKAHMHVVRITEFAWSTMEPSEGHFDFVWLDHAIAMAAKHNIKVVLGTPSAAPPAWLTTKHPDVLRRDENGRMDEHGNRQHFSFTSPTYRHLSARIAGEMAKRYGKNPNVLGWQLDNELANSSYDPSARDAFHAWLKAKYGTVAELNRRWATAYWSQTYDSFDEVPVHSHNQNPGLLLEWKRFVTDTWVSYCDNQITAMRPYLVPTQWITTNTMGWFNEFDHYKLEKGLDLAAWDDYVPTGKLDPFDNAARHDLTRGFKQQNFWVMETQPAFVNWGPVNAALPPGVTREMAWQAVGHGADAVLYWQWRSAPGGQEEYHGVLVGADGTPVPVYDEIQQLGADFAAATPALKGTSPHNDVAILHDYDSNWAIDFQKHSNKFDYIQQIVELYRALAPGEGGGTSGIDMISPLSDLAKYKVVFAPALNVLPAATATHLLDYVRNGGTLVLGTRSGMKNEDNSLNPERQPGPLEEALGARVEQFYALNDPIPVQGPGIAAGTATVWAEQLRPLTPGANILLTYGPGNGWLEGHPGAVSRTFGKGTIAYIGATLDVPTLRAVALPMLQGKGIVPLVAGLPVNIDIMERSDATHRVWIAINHGTTAQHIDLHRSARNVLTPTAQSSSTLDLAPHAVAVLALD